LSAAYTPSNEASNGIITDICALSISELMVNTFGE